jgi:hypothetical protein
LSGLRPSYQEKFQNSKNTTTKHTMTMVEATDDDLVDELEALRIKRTSDRPPPYSTVIVAPPSPHDTSPSETTEPLEFSQQQQRQQQESDDEANKSSENNDKSDRQQHCCNKNYTILCDMAYSMPREARPRKEKIRAIARQLINFLTWQQRQSSSSSSSLITRAGVLVQDSSSSSSLFPLPPLLEQQPALIKIVGCADAAIEQSLKDRMLELWVEEQVQQQAAITATTAPTTGDDDNSATTKPLVINLPNNLTFTQQSLESFLATSTDSNSGSNPSTTTTKKKDQPEKEVIYLSPDAHVTLDPATSPPPSIVIVGLLIDRKQIQVNRSLQRAHALSIPAVRWPALEKIVLVEEDHDKSATTMATTTMTNSTRTSSIKLHASEPLNCDCILEGMQQWYWNYEKWYHEACHHDHDVDTDDNDDDKKAAAAAAREACFSDAVLQALQHHVERHPGRPIHKTGC